MKKQLLFTLLLLSSNFVQSQDLEHAFDRFKGPALKLSGRISANQILYNAFGMENRKEPYTYFLDGNLNASLYGWNIPFSFSYSNEKFQHQNPIMQSFNRFGATPYYKWVKLYLGYNSMSFSPYTLNGHNFLGVGVELTPGDNFSFSSMYGRLLEETALDTATNVEPVYKRMGFGAKFAYRNDNGKIETSFFSAKDQVNEIFLMQDSTTLNPSENISFGIVAEQKITKSLKINFDYGSSAFTLNNNSAESVENIPFIYDKLNFLLNPRISTEFYDAFKAGLNYSKDGQGLGFAYNRVDPGYQTMGTYYFTNDIESYTINANTVLFNKKAQFSINIGLEKNNLENDKLSSTNRTVGSINSTLTPNPKLNISLSYSNFTSYTNIISDFEIINETNPFAQIDTLNFTQISQSINTNISYLLGDIKNKEKKQFLNISANSQLADNEQQTGESQKSKIYNGAVTYSLSLIPKNTTISISFLTNYSDMTEMNNLMLGPNLSISKQFFDKKLRASFSTAYNESYINQEKKTSVFNVRLNGAVNIKEKHKLRANLIFLSRNSTTANLSKFVEITFTLGYSYSFSKKMGKKKELKEKE